VHDKCNDRKPTGSGHEKKARNETVAARGSSLSAVNEAVIVATPAPAEPSIQSAAQIDSMKRARWLDGVLALDPIEQTSSIKRAALVTGEHHLGPHEASGLSTDNATMESAPLRTGTIPIVEPAGPPQPWDTEKPIVPAHAPVRLETSANQDPGATLGIDAHRPAQPTRFIEDSHEVNLGAAKGGPQSLGIDSHRNQTNSPVPTRSPSPGQENMARTTAISRGGLSRASTAAGPWPATNAVPGEQATQTPPPSHSLTRMRPIDSAPEPVLKTAHLKPGTSLIEGRQPMRNAMLDPLNAVLARDATGLAGAAQKPETSVAGAASAQAREPAVQDPFAALDAQRGAPSAAWIHAGAHHAEAGYLDPALGWVGVRADASAIGVHAAVLPGSAEAAQVLGSHLAGLNAYLSEHHGQSATVSLAAPQETGNGLEQGNPSGQDDGERGGQNQEKSGGRETFAVSPAPLAEKLAAAATNPAGVPATSGGHISVIA
jgi:hypothetical protein